MVRERIRTQPLSLLQGTVDVLALKVLARGPNHGYGVSQLIRQHTDGVLVLKDAALYQALHRLDRQRFVRSKWGLSDNNRKANYYQLTHDGRRHLVGATVTWEKYAEAVFKILRPA